MRITHDHDSYREGRFAPNGYIYWIRENRAYLCIAAGIFEARNQPGRQKGTPSQAEIQGGALKAALIGTTALGERQSYLRLHSLDGRVRTRNFSTLRAKLYHSQPRPDALRLGA